MESSQSDLPIEELPAGTVVGDFRIRQLLGTGGSSRVYLADQLSLDRPVALKIAQGSSREGVLQAALEHEHIVPVYSEQKQGHSRLIAMPYIPGITLADLLEALSQENREKLTRQHLLEMIRRRLEEQSQAAEREAGGAPENEPFARATCRIVLQLTSALRYAHTRGIVHRDVKPENVLVDAGGRALLMDFNVAVRTEQSPSTEPAVIGGTLPYMSPEQLKEISSEEITQQSEVDARSDLFSLGIVLYELLSGFRPYQVFEPDGAQAALARRMWAERIQGPPEFPVGASQISSDMKAVIAKCLQPNVVDRYQSAEELIEDLNCILQSRPLKFARDAGVYQRLRQWARHHTRACVVAVLIVTVPLLLVAGDYGTLAYRLGRAESEVGDLVGSEFPSVDGLLEAEQAVLDCRSVIAYPNLQTRRARLLHDLGLLFIRDGQFERSVVYFQQAVEADPRLGEAYSNLGVARYRLGEIEEALAAFDEAIRLGYDDAEVLANRGAARYVAGDIAGATEDLQAALRKNPDSPAAKRNYELLEKLRENR